MIAKLKNDRRAKFSFGKNSKIFEIFSKNAGAVCMHDWHRLSIEKALSLEYKIRAVFFKIVSLDGIFLFNISGVDIKSALKGFSSFEEASGNNMITEWELFMILSRSEYIERTIFHNGVNELILTKRGIKIKWN
jgi:hypothetical protein